jgi:hypothetical protein
MIPPSRPSFYPSRFNWKPRQKFSFRRKCWNPSFPKAWGSVGGHIQRFKKLTAVILMTVRSGLDMPSHGTQEIKKKHECIIVFIKFWRSAAEAAVCKLSKEHPHSASTLPAYAMLGRKILTLSRFQLVPTILATIKHIKWQDSS